MRKLSPEETERKKAIFDGMSPKRRKYIQKKGYDEWDPFVEPQDPIDIRKDTSKRTSQQLITEFLHAAKLEGYSNEYGRGAFDLCLGLVNNNERYRGMYDFACWYKDLLEREGPKK